MATLSNACHPHKPTFDEVKNDTMSAADEEDIVSRLRSGHAEAVSVVLTATRPTVVRGGDADLPSQPSLSGPPRCSRWPGLFDAQVVSISLPALDRLRRSCRAREVARFRRAVNIVTDQGPVALVTPNLGNGPFHLLVDRLPPELIEPAPIQIGSDHVHIGEWVLHLGDRTTLWNPRPAWQRLHLVKNRVMRLTTYAAAAAQARSSTSPFIPLLLEEPVSLLEDLRQALSHDECRELGPPEAGSALEAAVAPIVGLGPGLTPAGDDFLAGLIFALWATHASRAPSIAATIARVAASRTTWLSRAYLDAAAEGHADQTWHELLQSLCCEEGPDPANAAAAIVAFGATSGLDTLSGFLWTLRQTYAW